MWLEADLGDERMVVGAQGGLAAAYGSLPPAWQAIEDMVQPHQAAERAAAIRDDRLRKRPRGLAERGVGKSKPGVEVTAENERVITPERLQQAARLAGPRVFTPDPPLVDAGSVIEVRARNPQRPFGPFGGHRPHRRCNCNPALTFERQFDRGEIRQWQARKNGVPAILVRSTRRSVAHRRHVVHGEVERPSERIDLAVAGCARDPGRERQAADTRWQPTILTKRFLQKQ